MRIEGKVAVVTGAASGIGRAVARRFAAEGAKAVIAADHLQEDALQEAAAGCGAIPMVCDVTKESDIQAIVAETEHPTGPVRSGDRSERALSALAVDRVIQLSDWNRAGCP